MTDARHLLRPVSFMDLAQQIAIEASLESSYSDLDLMRTHNAVWIIVRMKVEFDKMPSIMDNVELRTWHRGIDRAAFLRDFKLVSESGESLIRASSSWITMDISERRMLRTSSLTDVIPAESECGDRALERDAEKVVIPEGLALKKSWEHTVAYSDTDYNHHANNAKYTQWVMDALPRDLVFEKTMKSIELNFINEARPGDLVEFFHACDGGETHYVEGRCNERTVFVSKIEI